MKKQIAVIAGGGTGGHLYPGIAIARAVQKMKPEIEIHFIGSKKGLESKIVPQEGFCLHLIPISGLLRMGPLAQMKTLFLIPLAFLKSLYLLLKLRPEFVLGVGGYASGPVLFVASLLRFRTAVWEPNIHPGLTNRWLAPLVNVNFLAFEETRKHLKTDKIQLVGLPVRETMKPTRREPHEKLRVLVFGGSQGARGINRTVIAAAESVAQHAPSWLDQVELVHQTGAADFEELKARYARLNRANVRVTPYIDTMHLSYAQSDLIFCRAGASTIAELAACEKAAVFIPLPTAADDHQRKNAEVLVQAGAAMMVEQREFSPETFIQLIGHFLVHPEIIKTFEEKIGQFYRPNSAPTIASQLLGAQV